jgi:hypothetical protein
MAQKLRPFSMMVHNASAITKMQQIIQALNKINFDNLMVFFIAPTAFYGVSA